MKIDSNSNEYIKILVFQPNGRQDGLQFYESRVLACELSLSLWSAQLGGNFVDTRLVQCVANALTGTPVSLFQCGVLLSKSSPQLLPTSPPSPPPCLLAPQYYLLSLSLSLYIYIYIYTHTHPCAHIHRNHAFQFCLISNFVCCSTAVVAANGGEASPTVPTPGGEAKVKAKTKASW